MSAPNWAHGTIWTGDCIEFMRGMNSATVDLIYLDPPFNSKADYAAPIGSLAAGAAFKDTWHLSDVDAEWINLIEDRHPAVHRCCWRHSATRTSPYLAYMAARLLEMPRILKDTGSLYLHCDPTMSHYLKLLLDAIFGGRFRNEIVWERTTGRKAGSQYGRAHDTILFYTATRESTWNPPTVPQTADTVRGHDLMSDAGGLYRLSDLRGAGPGPERFADAAAAWPNPAPRDVRAVALAATN